MPGGLSILLRLVLVLELVLRLRELLRCPPLLHLLLLLKLFLQRPASKFGRLVLVVFFLCYVIC